MSYSIYGVLMGSRIGIVVTFLFIGVIVVAYYAIMYRLNPLIDRYGNIPLILAELRYERDKDH